MRNYLLLSICTLAISTAPLAHAQLSADEKTFVENVAKGGMEEVQIARMAIDRVSDPKVKILAQRLIDDHTKVSMQLTDLAKQKGVTLPSEVTAGPDKLAKKNGKNFDKAFLDIMESKHEKSIKKFEKQVKSGTDADLKKWAETTLPTLQGHLLQIEGLE